MTQDTPTDVLKSLEKRKHEQQERRKELPKDQKKPLVPDTTKDPED